LAAVESLDDRAGVGPALLMVGWVWSLGLAVVFLAVVLVAMQMRRNCRALLRRRFGPEYERVIAGAEGRRSGEAELKGRARRRAHLDVVSLPESVQVAYRQSWRAVEEEFLDRPGTALASAELLLHRVMAERGYPVASFEEQTDLLSVDHPVAVESYRSAHAILWREQAGMATSDDLHEGLVRYRSLVEDLLRPAFSPPPGERSRQADRW
jgi:hypothetical protein